MLKYFVFSLILSCNTFGVNSLTGDPCLQLYKNQQGYGGNPSNVTNPARCYDRCRKTPNCKAFEWVPSNFGDKCFVFNVDPGQLVSNRPGVSHYSFKCGCSWQEYRNMRRFGGIEKPYSDLASCQQFCLTKVNCTAVEFDRLDGRPHCYHFSTDKAPNHDKQGLNHYTWRCLPDGGRQMTTSFSTYVGVTSNPGCYWIFRKNTNTHKSVKKMKAKTLQQCKQVCIELNQCKHGFDWRSSAYYNDRCWISENSALYDTPGIKHYSYVCTGQKNIWMKKEDMNSYEGKLLPKVYTLEECKDHCLSDESNCIYGFDWNRAAPLGQGCWISTNRNVHKAFVKGKVNHYYLTQNLNTEDDRFNPEECTWTTIQGNNSPGGKGRPMYNTLKVCQRECARQGTAGCKGIDWHPSNDIKCWFSVNDDLRIYPGVTHYVLKCPNEPTPSPDPSVTTTMRGSNTCGYVKYENSASNNGQRKTHMSDVDCRDHCSVDQTCNAYQWNGACYFFNQSREPQHRGNRQGSTYYRYVICNV